MPTSLRFFKDKNKARRYRRRDKAKYYSKNISGRYNQGNIWTNDEIKQILFAPKTDTQLSIELGRSINSIQIQRCRAKKHLIDYV